ncbi:putative SH3 domain protein [Trypanosoma theileri]|uniref:Putative SH3 domain protein n=1 Tax=Trypanosoma theileri TaxID=67003 RepID=A0A1X0P1K4_9TRYP|nr:putative SH3 domain protein [Trypanosoma theileri]XP_028884868.1 putative SH3 domain protein [Trypanosoma theileri]ORC78778.1 putative SH3 domain protein [Trypanosoma theileri]ORC90802.1 putative SH3 domain protein [Trypanosoma theileri]
MRYFRVLYNFNAEDNVELSVKKGEIVIPIDGDVMDGWIKVEVLNDAKRRGFVPLNFLRETTQPSESPQAPQPLSGATPTARQPSAIPKGTPSSFTSAALDYGDTLQHMYTSGTREPSVASRRSQSADQRTQRPSQVLGKTTTSTSMTQQRRQSPPLQQEQQQQQQTVTSLPSDPSSGRSLLNDPNAVIEAFMKNELHFKQLIRQRQDALAQMRSTLEGAMVEMAACKDKNATLARKLRDLDLSIDKERKRWKERIEEEKAFIARSMPQD